MKFSELADKVEDKQFIITEITKDKREFALAECGEGLLGKFICIDFGDDINRFINVDVLLLVLREFYGKGHIEELLKKIKTYDQLKDKELKDF